MIRFVTMFMASPSLASVWSILYGRQCIYPKVSKMAHNHVQNIGQWSLTFEELITFNGYTITFGDTSRNLNVIGPRSPSISLSLSIDLDGSLVWSNPNAVEVHEVKLISPLITEFPLPHTSTLGYPNFGAKLCSGHLCSSQLNLWDMVIWLNKIIICLVLLWYNTW